MCFPKESFGPYLLFLRDALIGFHSVENYLASIEFVVTFIDMSM